MWITATSNNVKSGSIQSVFTQTITWLNSHYCQLSEKQLLSIANIIRDDIRKFDPASVPHKYSKNKWLTIPSAINSRNVAENEAHVFINPNKQKLASWLHFGTKSHFIAPVRAKVLSWVWLGERFFSKGHYVNGIAPYNFFTVTDTAIKGLNKYVNELFKNKK